MTNLNMYRLGWFGIGLILMSVGLLITPSRITSQEIMISGHVVDENGVAVADAIVRIQTTDISTTTNAAGAFTLMVPDVGPHQLTAWAVGYFCVGPVEAQAGDVDVKLELVAHTADDNRDYQWLSAYLPDDYVEDMAVSNCESCHSNGQTLPFDEWVQDAHSQSAQNQRFLSMYTGTDLQGNQSPLTSYGYSRDYGRFPLAPDTAQPYYGPGYQLDFPDTTGNCAACHVPVAAINAPYATNPALATGVELEGVACDFCHKVWNVVLNDDGIPYANRPGVMSFEFRRPPEGHQFFAGPYDDVAPGEDTYSALQQESAFCAPCHFGIFWDTPIYNSFGEWLDSPYSDPVTGKTCQDCHMPTLEMTHFAKTENGGRERNTDTIFTHLMPGAADENLLQNTAELDVQAERINDEIQVTVSVTNTQAGHHIPTDSPLRQIFLIVEVYDESGSLLEHSNGSQLPDWAGDLAGLPGTYYAKILQQLWTEITPSGSYWTHTRIAEDTRLPAFATDTSTYTFTAPTDEAITVEVRLIFRRAFYELMQQKQWDVPVIEMEYIMITVD